MVTMIVLWVFNMGNPAMIGKFEVNAGHPTLSAREEQRQLNDCETAAMSLRAEGIKAWCSPVLTY